MVNPLRKWMRKTTRYQSMWRTKDVERALKRYETDKEKLDADFVHFQPIDDMDMGESYLISYDMPVIVPISEILWIRFVELFEKWYMWTLVSDGYTQLMLVKNADNMDTIVKMLCVRNKKLIYGENKDLKRLFENDFEQFRKLLTLHPNEDAANIQVDPALLPIPKIEELEELKTIVDTAKKTEEPITPYIPPKKQELESVAVPENAPFAVEMKLLLHLSKKHPDRVRMTFYEPVSASSIDAFEQRNNIKLTDELKMLFSFTNGFSLSAGHMEIDSLDFIERSLSAEWEWGDTKNYVCIGDMIGDGEIILLDLDSGTIITNDHGKETDYGDLTTLLSYIISLFLDGEVGDVELDAYISQIETYE